MITQFKNIGILNRDKWMRVYKRGDAITQEMVDEYIKSGGATVELKPEKKEVSKKTSRKKPAKKVVKKKK